MVANVRGVETGYTEAGAYITISESKSWIQDVFDVLEPYLAFIMATTIIVSASSVFPFYLLPLIFAVIALFLYLVYN